LSLVRLYISSVSQQLVKGVESIIGSVDAELKKRALDYRRCVVLAFIGSTPSNFTSLDHILSNGYLTSVKAWLDGMLASTEGRSLGITQLGI
jgi:hypothetical protein